jgi:hypothetical protein
MAGLHDAHCSARRALEEYLREWDANWASQGLCTNSLRLSRGHGRTWSTTAPLCVPTVTRIS